MVASREAPQIADRNQYPRTDSASSQQLIGDKVQHIELRWTAANRRTGSNH
jgi:hypothetical protein